MKMNRAEILRRVIQMIHIQTSLECIKEDENLSDDLGMDSLDLTEIVIRVEKEFSIHIPDEEVEEKLKTVGDIVDMVEKLLKSA